MKRKVLVTYLKSSCILIMVNPCNHGKQATPNGHDSVSQSSYQNNGDKPTICISVALSIRTLRGRSHSSRGLLRRMESFRHSSAKLCLVWVTLEIMSTARSYNCKERGHSSDYNNSPLQYSEAHAQLYAYNHTVT